MLFHRGCRHRMIFDVRGDHDRLDVVKAMHAMLLAPGEELRNGIRVGGARKRFPDCRRKEFNEAPSGRLTGPAESRPAGFQTRPARAPATVPRYGRLGVYCHSISETKRIFTYGR